jgi:plastocyanin
VAPAPPVVVTITVVAAGFSPPAATVSPGANVTWVQADPAKGSMHAIAFGTPRQPNTVIGGSPAMAKGSSFTVALTVPGTYPYYDGLHPTLVGTLTVAPK